MTFLGERKTLGIFILCWAWAEIADIKVIFDHPHREMQWMHIRIICIVLILGILLIRS